MKLRQIMSPVVIRTHPQEPISAAARTLAHYNIGALPVCGSDGRLCGLLTDRDIVTRCIAVQRSADATRVGEVMTTGVVTADVDMDTALAASLMAKNQIRRLPVVENGRLCGMVSLADLAGHEDTSMDAAEALGAVSSHLKNFQKFKNKP